MKKSIFICTPAFDGKVNVQYAIALSETVSLLERNGIEVKLRLSTSDSLICSARNRLNEDFLKSGCTHMLCIDSDLGWPAEAVLGMLQHDEDFVAGMYPARRGDGYFGRPLTNEDGSLMRHPTKLLMKVDYIPAGFMLITRRVIRKMQADNSDLYYCPKHADNQSGDGYYLFNIAVRDGEFWGEDYQFCYLARKSGFDIWVDPIIGFDHNGKIGKWCDTFSDKSPQEQQAEKEEV